MGHVGASVGVKLHRESVGQAEEGVEFVRLPRVDSVASIGASTVAYFRSVVSTGVTAAAD